MQHGGTDGDTYMEGPENENGGEIARPEPDAAAAEKGGGPQHS